MRPIKTHISNALSCACFIGSSTSMSLQRPALACSGNTLLKADALSCLQPSAEDGEAVAVGVPFNLSASL